MKHISPPQQLPTEGYLRLTQVLRFIPVSKSTWWQWVKTGKAPQPIHLGPKITAWKASDIRSLLDKFEALNKIAA